MRDTHISQHLSTGLGGKEVYWNGEVQLYRMADFLGQLCATSIGQHFQWFCIQFCQASQHREFEKTDVVGWFSKGSLKKKKNKQKTIIIDYSQYDNLGKNLHLICFSRDRFPSSSLPWQPEIMNWSREMIADKYNWTWIWPLVNPQDHSALTSMKF